MPKMKTKSGAAKRFKVRGGRLDQAPQAFKRHILTKKSTKRKRQLRGAPSGATIRRARRSSPCCPTR